MRRVVASIPGRSCIAGISGSIALEDNKPIRGRVLAFDKRRRSAVIDIGSKYGVLEGHVFIVRRRGEYIGEIVVQSVRTEMAACTVWRMKDDIAIGDDVETEPPSP